MNAPLVVVQGDLLLPTLYPLASMPNAVYGEEWTLASARPALTEYEIPFYAARFLTAYISPLSLPNERFPYTPSSLWGMFKRAGETVQTGQPGLAATPAETAPLAAQPAPFASEPFSASEDRIVKAAPANDRRKQVAGGAIALACAAFIAWALFGTQIGNQKPKQPALALNATPEAEPASAASAASAAVVAVAPSAVSSVAPSSSTAVAAVSPGPSRTEASPTPIAVPASTLPALANAALPASTLPALANAALPASNTLSVPGIAAPTLVASGTTVTPSANTSAFAGNGDSATSSKTLARVTRPQVVAKTKPFVVAQTSERGRAKIHGKLRHSVAVNREARGYEVAQRRHGHEYIGTPVYRSSGFDAPLAAPGRRSRPHNDMRTASSGSSLSVAEMYTMLAHSAVLDDNSGASRQTVRASSIATARAGSGDSSNWSSDISQRRVTDPGSQFLK